MLIPMLIDQPQLLAAVLRGTPTWVWALLVARLWLGFSQARDRDASLLRVGVVPVVMTGLAVWGMVSAFGASPMFGYAMLMWMFALSVTFALVGSKRAPEGTQYDPGTRSF